MKIDSDKIYDKRTRTYFNEVVNCYNNNSYRAAIVVLYSVCLSDLFYKLQELSELYNDSQANQIIEEIENQISNNKTSPAWEQTLVNRIFTKLKLLDSPGYILLSHLRDYRNLTAHPVLDSSNDLYCPCKQLVESCILDACNNILFKPSIFIKNIVDFMSNDLASKKDYILASGEEFRNYINKKYLMHMSTSMMLKVYKAFWKFTFVLDDEECDKNRLINLNLIEYLSKQYLDEIIVDMSSCVDSFELTDKDKQVLYMMYLLARVPELYNPLAEHIKTLINRNIETKSYYKLVSWFKSTSKEIHINQLISDNFTYLPERENHRKFIENSFKDDGTFDVLLKYYIFVLKKASSFKSVNLIMDTYILPNLDKMSPELFQEIISVFNSNKQVYDNYQFSYYCIQLWKVAKKHLNRADIKTKYTRFKFLQ